MASFSNLYCSGLYPYKQECQANSLRLSIFLITGDCVGLPVFAWAFWVFYCHYKRGGRISTYMITLLLCDLLVLLLNPYIVAKLLQDQKFRTTTPTPSWISFSFHEENDQEANTRWLFTSLWSGFMISGLYLQQVVALEGALSVRHPIFSNHVFFPSCSIIVSSIVFIGSFLCELFKLQIMVFLILPVLLVITLTSCIVTCRAPPHIGNATYEAGKPSYVVLALVTFTVVLHATYFIKIWIWWHPGMLRYDHLTYLFVCLASLRMLTDPVLCVIICRKNLSSQKSKSHAEPITDIELT